MSSGRHHWLDRIVESPAVGEIQRRVVGAARVVVEGAWGSSTTLVAGSLAVRMGRPVLLVVAHLDDADDAVEDLELFRAAGYELEKQRFGALEVLPGESAISLELLAERLAVVGRLAGSEEKSENRKPKTESGLGEQDPKHSYGPSPRPSPGGRGGKPFVLVASVQALMQGVPEPGALGQFQMSVRAGEDLPQERLIQWLAEAGYNRAEVIEQPGDFAVRGGIIDIYLPSSGAAEDGGDAREGQAAASSATAVDGDTPLPPGPLPVRLDYFGDEVETISLIDTDTMGSGRKLRKIQLIGASAKRIQSDDRTVNLVTLLPADTVVVLSEVLELSEQARGYYERLTNARGIFAPATVFKMLTERPNVQVNQYSSTARKEEGLPLPVRPLMSFAHDAGQAVTELTELAAEAGASVVTLCQKPAEKERLGELLQEHVPDKAEQVDIEVGYLHRGFVWGAPEEESKVQGPMSNVPKDSGIGLDDGQICLVPHHELFHRYQTRRRIRRISSSTTERATDAFLDLNVGDFVVHADHGIARFTGLRTMRQKGVTEEFLTLEFAQKALLHVPATQIDLVQKYIGGFEGRPPLSVLGGKRWAKQKEAVAEAVKDMAAEMIRIQAARSSLPGVRYPADTPWQKEFEAEFPYEETEDQLAAIHETKKDMSDEQPMDRLICGDVGFGKTEIAIRAAFKAVEFGKQVAVLVPTTVLAEQHERTFRDRMADYPFRIESVSRFKSGGEARKVLDDLAKGQVDIIIGTHRLLSKDVKFADLGLVITDEEQRFGVEHKQKLLQFRLTVDVLTLSATPIPRTLHMAMLGLRDISSLSTAPMDRRAIVTEVIPYDSERIRRALIRELSRDGQVFFVHNRIHNIQSVADDIQKLAPDAKIVIGHGQMAPHELEEVMLTFMRREADILVSTTIIESGIDIPTANTIFINQADQFGLADLHQLRGRVGRYKHRAYAYLLLPKDRPITETATRRLRAIEQYSMLGAGFKIAMRDLEIRGAGNILGAEQSGHIAAVGYEMYCTLLEQAAKKLRNERIIEPVKTHLELPAPATGIRIPPAYINSDKYRMEAYRRLSRSASLEEFELVVKDIIDAYGKPPAPVQTLIDLTEVRIAASTLEVDAIKREGPDLIFRTRHPQRLNDVFKEAPGRVSIVDEQTIYWRPPNNYLDPPETLLAVLRKLIVRRVQGA